VEFKSRKDRPGNHDRGSSSDGRGSSDERSGSRRQRKDNQEKTPILCRHFMGGEAFI